MKVLIVSDSHRRNENLMKVLEKEKPLDLVIHCGDAEGSEGEIIAACGCPLYIVAGNNDYFSNLNNEAFFEIEGYKVMLTHGHHYYVSMGVERLADEARAQEVDIVMFGHTHRPFLEIMDDLTILNPGSISYPRQAGSIPTYMIMYIDEQGEINYETKYVDEF